MGKWPEEGLKVKKHSGSFGNMFPAPAKLRSDKNP